MNKNASPCIHDRNKEAATQRLTRLVMVQIGPKAPGWAKIADWQACQRLWIRAPLEFALTAKVHFDEAALRRGLT